MKIVAILLFPLLLTGCYTQTSVKDMIKDTESYQPPYIATPEKGLIYVVRPSSFYGIFKYNVFLDGKSDSNKIGYTRGNQYIYTYVDPGQHTITSTAENTASLTLDISAGETLYLSQDATFGFLFGRNNLNKINPVEGKYYIKHSQLGTLNQTSP